MSLRLRTGGEDGGRTGGEPRREADSLPLHLTLTPAEPLGQVEVLIPEEMAEFRKEFVICNVATQIAGPPGVECAI